MFSFWYLYGPINVLMSRDIVLASETFPLNVEDGEVDKYFSGQTLIGHNFATAQDILMISKRVFLHFHGSFQ